MIKHLWFDFSETLGTSHKETHKLLCYSSYASIVHRPVTDELIREYENLYEKFNHSNAALFRSLGQPANYWLDQLSSIPPGKLFLLADTAIPEILAELKKRVPISLFSNIELKNILPALGIDAALFTHILGPHVVKEPKPALEGYYKMIELSGVPPHEILYIGDHVGKDVLPAKKVGIKAGLMWSASTEADYCFTKFENILKMF